jgi:hypothetical protein
VKHLKALIGAGGNDQQREELCIFDPCPAKKSRAANALANGLIVHHVPPGSRRLFQFATIEDLDLYEGFPPGLLDGSGGWYGDVRGRVAVRDEEPVRTTQYHLVVRRPSWEDDRPAWSRGQALPSKLYLVEEAVVYWKKQHEDKMRRQINQAYVALPKVSENSGKRSRFLTVDVRFGLQGSKESVTLQRFTTGGSAKDVHLTVADLKRELAFRKGFPVEKFVVYPADRDAVTNIRRSRDGKGHETADPLDDATALTHHPQRQTYTVVLKTGPSNAAPGMAGLSAERDAFDDCFRMQRLMLQLYNGACWAKPDYTMPAGIKPSEEPAFRFFSHDHRMRRGVRHGRAGRRRKRARLGRWRTSLA